MFFKLMHWEFIANRMRINTFQADIINVIAVIPPNISELRSVVQYCPW